MTHSDHCSPGRIILGADVGAPKRAGDQAKKTIVIEAWRTGDKKYEVRPDGRNSRLLNWLKGERQWPSRPGWTLAELANSLASDRAVHVGAFDFPFSIPVSLLLDSEFASQVQKEGCFETRAAWVEFVKCQLRLEFSNHRANGEMVGLAFFDKWRNRRFWHFRACDTATRGSPPLKHERQNLFAMTLVGVKFLETLREHDYHVILSSDFGGDGRYVVETYPREVARRVGFTASYKDRPDDCLHRALSYLIQRGVCLSVDPDIFSFCTTYRTGTLRNDPDGSDAFLCLVAAICYRERMSEFVHGEATQSQRTEEGAMVVPEAAGHANGSVQRYEHAELTSFPT